MAKTSTSSQAVMKLDTRAKGLFKDNVQEYVDTFGGSLPPGEYETKLSQAVLYANKNGDPQVDFIFVVTDGECKGQNIRDMHSIVERGKRTVDLCLRIVAGRLQRMGHKTDDINSAAALNRHLEQLTKEAPAVHITVKDDQYRGIESLRLLNGEADSEGTEEGGEGPSNEEGNEGDNGGEAELVVGSRVTVNDPNDADSPWSGEVVSINNDQEVEVKQDETGDEWVVQVRFISMEE